VPGPAPCPPSLAWYRHPVSAAAHTRFSVAEYVRLEERANVKHEFLEGTIWAMAGGTPEHAAIASAIIAALSAALRGRPCRVYTSDARVRVAATGFDTYPDVTVVCGRAELDPEDKNALTNPLVLVEITSDGTEAYDRGEKLDHYKRISSLREVMIVSHREHRIDVHRRTETGEWTTLEARERAELASIGATLVVEEIYRDPLAG
jgi:Uma2 family endonuclease